jgi:hypothetical protein
MAKYNFKHGAAVGIFYMQWQGKDKTYTMGIHNGAFDYYDSKRKIYVVRHSGSALKEPDGNYKFSIHRLIFYESQSDYNHNKQIGDNYWVLDMRETRDVLKDYTHHPGIAFKTASGTVHNGKFSAFIPAGSTTEITHYDDIIGKIKAGKLTYWHYNTKGLGSARYEVLEEQLSVDILDMTKLI